MAQQLLLAPPPSMMSLMRGSLRAPTKGGGARSNCCAIGVWAPRVYGPRKLKFGTLVPNNTGPRLPLGIHIDPETAQERLRNGSINGRESLEPVVSASLIGHPLSWKVPLVSDNEPRRAGYACARVPERPFPPRLYHAPCARACARARPCVRKSKVAPRC